MSREEMVKRSWKPYMMIEYKHTRMMEGIRCMLISINFDDEIMELQPIGDNYYSQSFFSSIQNCSLPKKLKVVSLNGKKIEDKIYMTRGKVQESMMTLNPTS